MTTLTLRDFEATQPFAVRFFTEAISTGHMVNAYILRGKPMGQMYRLVLRLAQLLNCTQKPDPLTACGHCQSCRWIGDNAHPSVITVSNKTYSLEIDPDTGEVKTKSGKTSSQTKIVVSQLQALIKELSLHSLGFHRIVILTGAEEVPDSADSGNIIPAPKDWAPQNDGSLSLMPLDRKLFDDAPSNKFLKTLEEPPLDVTFFLLTDAENKLLETIVSRCQVVPFAPLPENHQLHLTPQARQAFGEMMQAAYSRDCLAGVRLFADYVASTHLSPHDAMRQLTLFVWDTARPQLGDPQVYRQVKNQVYHLDQARRMLKDRVREEAVVEDLFLNLAQGLPAG